MTDTAQDIIPRHVLSFRPVGAAADKYTCVCLVCWLWFENFEKTNGVCKGGGHDLDARSPQHD